MNLFNSSSISNQNNFTNEKITNTSNFIEKTKITLIYQDQEQSVTWFSDTPISDARFAVMCACDSLVDGEFQVLDDKATLIDFKKIESFRNNQFFFIRKLNSNPSQILLDSRRKLYVEIPSLRHIEAKTALKNMLLGANLLKHKRKSFPHLRLFQISSDLKRLFWYTKSKKIDEAQVVFNQVHEISFGQDTGSFKSFPLKILEDFSFTLHYYKNQNFEKKKALEITCKDEREFDLWVIGIKALCAHNSNKLICKDALLSHSKSYLEQISKGNLSKCSSYLFYPSAITNNNCINKNEDSLQLRNNIHKKSNNHTIDMEYYSLSKGTLNNIYKAEEILDSDNKSDLKDFQKQSIAYPNNKILNDLLDTYDCNNDIHNLKKIDQENKKECNRTSYIIEEKKSSILNETANHRANKLLNRPKSLDQFMITRNLSKYQFAKLILKIAFKFKKIRDQVEYYTSHDEYNAGKAFEENYEMVFSEEAIADDIDSQKSQMINLYKESQIKLSNLIFEFINFEKNLNNSSKDYCNIKNINNKCYFYSENTNQENKFEKFKLNDELEEGINKIELKDIEKDEFSDYENEIDGYKKIISKLQNCLETFLDKYNMKNPNLFYEKQDSDEKNFLKGIDLVLWKIEIDLENICDIINRFNSNRDIGFLDKIKNVFRNIFS